MVISKKKSLHFESIFCFPLFDCFSQIKFLAMAQGGPKKSIHGPLLEMFGDPWLKTLLEKEVLVLNFSEHKIKLRNACNTDHFCEI